MGDLENQMSGMMVRVEKLEALMGSRLEHAAPDDMEIGLEQFVVQLKATVAQLNELRGMLTKRTIGRTNATTK